MADTRKKNANWNILNGNYCWTLEQYSYMQLAVLMDIRDELQTLNNVFRCHNALAIPHLLRDIKRFSEQIKKNTTKKPRRKKAA